MKKPLKYFVNHFSNIFIYFALVEMSLEQCLCCIRLRIQSTDHTKESVGLETFGIIRRRETLDYYGNVRLLRKL